MADLSFQIEGCQPIENALTPTLEFLLRVDNDLPDQEIHSVVLRCQIQIEAPRRRYTSNEKEQLEDLYGAPERWGQTLKPLLWMNTTVAIPEFVGSTLCSVPVPYSLDLDVSTAKYFHALEGGMVPLTFLFSGTVFYRGVGGGLQVAPISWNKEARFSLNADHWKEMMQRYHADGGWVCIPRSLFEELYQYRMQSGLATWDEALRKLLNEGRPKASASYT